MCDPLTIAGVALSAGSMIANQSAQSSVMKARNSAMQAERQRQQTLQKEATALNETSRGRYDNFQGQQQQQGGELASYFNDQNEGLPTGDPNATGSLIPTSSSNIVVREQEKQNAKAKNFSEQQGDALGNLRAFGDVLGGIGRGQARDASQIGTVGGFMRGSSNVLPLELEAANSKGGGARMLGDILGGLGSLGMSAGLSGAGPSFSGVKSSLFGKPMVGPLLPGQSRPNIGGLFNPVPKTNIYSLTGG